MHFFWEGEGHQLNPRHLQYNMIYMDFLRSRVGSRTFRMLDSHTWVLAIPALDQVQTQQVSLAVVSDSLFSSLRVSTTTSAACSCRETASVDPKAPSRVCNPIPYQLNHWHKTASGLTPRASENRWMLCCKAVLPLWRRSSTLQGV